MSSVLLKRLEFRSGFVKKIVTVGQRGLFQISKEVQEAVKYKQPVVALESTIYTHGRQF